MQSTERVEFLNDPQNFTGYSQVIRETHRDGSGELTKEVTYTFGLDELSQTTVTFENGQASSPTTVTFAHDGHGSVRALLDAAGAIATLAGHPGASAIRQLFTYDAYGNALGFNMSAAATVLLYSGEQFDQRIEMQSLRRRFYDAASGRFVGLDDFTGNSQDPQSFHKYLYTHANPIIGVDPSGLSGDFSLSGMLSTVGTYMNGAMRIGNVGYKIYRKVEQLQNLFSVFDFVQRAMKVVRVLASASGPNGFWGAIQAQFQIPGTFSPTNVIGELANMYGALGFHWNNFINAAQNKGLPSILSKLAEPARALQFTQWVMKNKASSELFISISLPSGPAPTSGIPNFKFWVKKDELEIRQDNRGGRLLDISIGLINRKKGTVIYVTLARIDYMKYGASGTQKLQGHYHVFGQGDNKHLSDQVFYDPFPTIGV